MVNVPDIYLGKFGLLSKARSHMSSPVSLTIPLYYRPISCSVPSKSPGPYDRPPLLPLKALVPSSCNGLTLTASRARSHLA